MARKPSFVPWSSVGVGDTIRATQRRGDLLFTAEGKVQEVVRNGLMRIYTTGEGHTLFVEYIDKRATVVVEMVQKYVPDTGVRLF